MKSETGKKVVRIGIRILLFFHSLVSFEAVFWDVTQRSLGERCVTSLKATAKETMGGGSVAEWLGRRT